MGWLLQAKANRERLSKEMSKGFKRLMVEAFEIGYTDDI